MTRHAEIAGGGIGGLGLGMMLARHGWSVRVHERSPEIRELGAGIYIKNNSMRVFEHYGVLPRLERHATPIEMARIRNGQGKIMQQRVLAGHSRVMVMPRQNLVDELAAAAREAGVEVVTDSQIASADEKGALIDVNGKRYSGDLVVAADGLHSRTRDSLGLEAKPRDLDTLIDRFLVPTRSFTQEPVTTEYWSGHRRIGITACGEQTSYIYVVMPASDRTATFLPLDTGEWMRSHPVLKTELDILSREPSTQYPYSVVHCRKWHKGRVAIVGDAAHGLPPTLGQGAGLTLMNSHALAEIVSSGKNVEASLGEWERMVRFISDATQTWAVRYDRFTRQWPNSLSLLRPGIVWAFGRFPYLNDKMRIADRGLDLTSIPLAEEAPR